jgi:hypothetical protein
LRLLDLLQQKPPKLGLGLHEWPIEPLCFEPKRVFLGGEPEFRPEEMLIRSRIGGLAMDERHLKRRPVGAAERAHDATANSKRGVGDLIRSFNRVIDHVTG